MDKYRILKTYSPMKDTWGYSLQRQVVIKRWFRRPLIEWDEVGFTGVYAFNWSVVVKWHRLYHADVYEEHPATGVVYLIYSEPKNICQEGIEKPIATTRTWPVQ